MLFIGRRTLQSQLVLYYKIVVCGCVCLFVCSLYLRQFRMYEAEITQACPGNPGDVHTINIFNPPGLGFLQRELCGRLTHIT